MGVYALENSGRQKDIQRNFLLWSPVCSFTPSSFIPSICPFTSCCINLDTSLYFLVVHFFSCTIHKVHFSMLPNYSDNSFCVSVSLTLVKNKNFYILGNSSQSRHWNLARLLWPSFDGVVVKPLKFDSSIFAQPRCICTEGTCFRYSATNHTDMIQVYLLNKVRFFRPALCLISAVDCSSKVVPG